MGSKLRIEAASASRPMDDAAKPVALGGRNAAMK
jgi:hypothetical protein